MLDFFIFINYAGKPPKINERKIGHEFHGGFSVGGQGKRHVVNEGNNSDDCADCVAQFVHNGGCIPLLAGDDPAAARLISEECRPCRPAALVECQTRNETGVNRTDGDYNNNTSTVSPPIDFVEPNVLDGNFSTGAIDRLQNHFDTRYPNHQYPDTHYPPNDHGDNGYPDTSYGAPAPAPFDVGYPDQNHFAQEPALSPFEYGASAPAENSIFIFSKKRKNQARRLKFCQFWCKLTFFKFQFRKFELFCFFKKVQQATKKYFFETPEKWKNIRKNQAGRSSFDQFWCKITFVGHQFRSFQHFLAEDRNEFAPAPTDDDHYGSAQAPASVDAFSSSNDGGNGDHSYGYGSRMLLYGGQQDDTYGEIEYGVSAEDCPTKEKSEKKLKKICMEVEFPVILLQNHVFQILTFFHFFKNSIFVMLLFLQ